MAVPIQRTRHRTKTPLASERTVTLKPLLQVLVSRVDLQPMIKRHEHEDDDHRRGKGAQHLHGELGAVSEVLGRRPHVADGAVEAGDGGNAQGNQPMERPARKYSLVSFCPLPTQTPIQTMTRR